MSVTIIKNKFVKAVNENWTEDSLLGEYPAKDKLFDLLIKYPFHLTKDRLPGITFFKFNDVSGQRLKENIGSFEQEYIIIDYDSGVTIQDFVTRFKDNEFWLYTSTSHTLINHKFRVIMKIKMDTILPIEEHQIFEKVMLNVFKGCDTCSFQINRLMFLPSDYYGGYFSYKNDGKALRIQNATLNTARILMCRKDSYNIKVKKEYASNQKASLETCMNQSLVRVYMNTFSNKMTGNQDGMSKLWSALSSLKGMNACEEAIEEVIDHAVHSNKWMRSDVIKMCKKIGLDI